MDIKINKEQIPVLVLIGLSSLWTFFYSFDFWLNDYGAYKPDWLFLLDILIIVPLVCILCIKDTKEAVLKSIVYICLLVLLGSWIIPDSSKDVWHLVELLRYVALGILVLFETVTLCTVFYAIRASLNNQLDPDLVISNAVVEKFGDNWFSNILKFEARVWTYCLFYKRCVDCQFEGHQHFSCFKKDGTQSNLLGFIILIAIELPIVHILVHFIWSPVAANIITGLTVIGLVYFVAEYRAIALRPISISNEELIIRYGVWNPVSIALKNIRRVSQNNRYIKRSARVKRYNFSGVPNVELELEDGNFIYLGVDEPSDFIEELKRSINAHWQLQSLLVSSQGGYSLCGEAL